VDEKMKAVMRMLGAVYYEYPEDTDGLNRSSLERNHGGWSIVDSLADPTG
jgi:hypothetical protein